MPEYEENDDEIEDIEDEGVRGARKAQRATEQANKQLREQLAQAEADRRELAAIKAGLDPADKASAFFLKHYDGDLSSDAMKTAAIEAGVLPEVGAEAAASSAGQAQMASAFRSGETTPLGSTTVGPAHMRKQVPAEEAEMWQDFEAAVKRGDSQAMQAGLEVLRAHGRQVTGIEGYEYELGAGSPQITPISGRPV